MNVMPAPTGRTAMRAALAALTIAAAGCSSGGSPPAAQPRVRTVTVHLVATGCSPRALSVPAGPTRFVVTNASTPAFDEFEIHSGANIVAEAELVAPGVSKTFAITLAPGHFTTRCKGGPTHSLGGTLTVTGPVARTPSRISASDAARAVARYRTYLDAQAALLVARTTPFVAAVERGDIALAKELSAAARVPYEHIEPVAETFGDLDPRIDARVNDVPAAHWGGFHRIERARWVEDDVTAMGPTARQLLTDVTTLEHLVKSVPLQPATIANGAVQLLNEVTTSKITGEEERYSHLDLVDLAANVEGSQAAFDAVAPLLPAGATVSPHGIDARFAEIIRVLAPFRRGGGYVPYTALTETDTRALSQATDGAAEPLSRVAELVLT
jgi:iron uptake system component EfeO